MSNWILRFRRACLVSVASIMCVGCFNYNRSVIKEQNEGLYKIDNLVLKEYIAAFNEEFKGHESAQGKGLRIHCIGIYDDSIVYDIGYMGGFVFSEPVVFCEPIDGKPVVLVMNGLHNEFSMDMTDYIELMKNVVSDDTYHITKESQRKYKENKVPDGFAPAWLPVSIDDFISLRLTFDKSYHLLRVDTLGVR